MNDLQIDFVNRSAFKGGNIDILNQTYNKRKTSELKTTNQKTTGFV